MAVQFAPHRALTPLAVPVLKTQLLLCDVLCTQVKVLTR
jgi:hypothetical protein